MKHPEQQLHFAVADYLNVALPTDAWWTTIPAGGGGKVRGAILKAMGYRAGTPDILIVYRGKAFWLELKAPGGRISPAQNEAMNRLMYCGCAAVYVCFTLEHVEKALRAFRIPLSARTMAA